MIDRIEILGVEFDNLTKSEAVAEALQLIEKHTAEYVVTPNPEIVMMCQENPEEREAIKNAKMVLPDGIGVVKAAITLGTPLKERVAGIDFASELMSQMSARGMSVFFFGAKPGIAEQAAENIKIKYPGLVIAGTENGYFNDDTAIKEKINEAKPDFLLVCLGAPKQEMWMHINAGRLDVGLMAGLGGVLDVYAGIVERAPERWQKMGLEWLYRLLKNPKRLKRMMKLPEFLLKVQKQKRQR